MHDHDCSAHPPQLAGRVTPRCPPYRNVTSVDELMPYLDAVARRPFDEGLHAAWDLQAGEHVLVRVDNWHDPLVVEATLKTLDKFGCTYDVRELDNGPMPQDLAGSDEIEWMSSLTEDIADWFDEWKAIEEEGRYDKLLWGMGGPVFGSQRLKIQRMPFPVREMLASDAHTFPWQLLHAIDDWTWKLICRTKRMRITDPEGTDLTYTNHDTYYTPERDFFADEHMDVWFPDNKRYARSYLPGHVWGKPWFYIDEEDGAGVAAGTMNHVGLYPHMKMHLEGSRVVAIEGGGRFGEKLRTLLEDTRSTRYPGFPGDGLLYWWENAIGTNPKIHRPRHGYLSGWNCAFYERVRSGIVHLGFGTVISSRLERDAVRSGMRVGHFHIHLLFPTVTCETVDGTTELLIQDGRHKALDDPKIRELAQKFGDPDVLLQEQWIPAVPGLTVDGDYWRDYAQDPTDWTKTELKICEKWHPLFMKMTGAEHAHA